MSEFEFSFEKYFFQEESFSFERGKKIKMTIKEILDEYLGKHTEVALKELPQMLWELNYHFNFECAFFHSYSNDYTYIVGYILDEENRTVTLYSGFLDYFCGYIKDLYGYFAYKDLLKFSKNIVKTIIKFSNYIHTSKYEIFTGYLEHLEKNGYNFEEEKLKIAQ